MVMNVQWTMNVTQHRIVAILSTVVNLFLRQTALVCRPVQTVATNLVRITCFAMHKHLVRTRLVHNPIRLLMWVRITVGRTTLMLRRLVLFLVRVVPAKNVLNLVLSIHVSPTHHVMIAIHTFVAPLGAMRRLIAYFPVPVVTMVTAPREPLVSHTQVATIMNLLCVELALKMRPSANGPVQQEVVANVPTVSHASLTQHAERKSP
mmetsp:Transcript_29711/g.62574  ORF Transcript_29711/g.62574 Transcript_29711/m.62574 type:complete len:206 (+) Transcript_29711:1818-2435(+)